jgi:hypothetical protein
VYTLVQLVADGTCLYLGESAGCHGGQTAMFRHRQPDGAEILTVYAHLAGLGNLRVGERYPLGTNIGAITATDCAQEDYLHFAVAYGATWDTDLSRRAAIPANAGTTWIENRYLNPVEYLRSRHPTNRDWPLRRTAVS